MSDSPPSMNSISSLDCWDYTIELECLRGTEDLQLAAELGKTLLERNKELETSLKQHQNVIEDQTQEIEYLTKQTVALREVNDSRLRIYEQLEVSIQDLERANHRLAVENTNDKKHIKSLTATIESLETKCEELQCNIDELKIELDVCKKKAHNNNGNNNQRSSSDNGQARKAKTNDGGRGGGDEVDSGSHREQNRCDVTTKPSEKSQQTQTTPNKQNTSDQADDVAAFDSNVEQIAQLMSQLRERNSQCTRDCRRIAELEEQLATMIQQNQELEGHIVNLQCKDADMKSMHEELNTLEEVRQGQLCSKCLRTVDSRDDMSLSLCDDREDDDSSMMEALTSTSQHRSSFSMEVQEVDSLQDLTRREMTMYWTLPSASASIISILIDLCLYFKDRYLLPLLYKSFTYPFLILHLLKHDKIHRL